MHAAARMAGRQAARHAGRAYHTYKHRFGVVSKGAGIGKLQSLQVGSWSESNDSQSLARLWPTKMVSSTEALEAIRIFDNIITKSAHKSAYIGKGKAYLVLGDFPAAKAAASASGIKEGDKEYPAWLALQASIAVSELAHVTVVEAADPTFSVSNKAALEQAASETFLKLAAALPNDWSSRMAHGEYLLMKKDPAAASVLKDAVEKINKEVNGRLGKSAVFIADANSASALADYVDYKYTATFKSSLKDVLQEETERTDAAMEKIIAAKYPNLAPEELVAIARLDSDVAAGALGFNLGYKPVSVNVKQWTTPNSMESIGLVYKYTGGALGAVQRSADVDLDAALATIASSSDSVDLSSVVELQHSVAAKLAKQVQYRCKILLAQALLLNHAAKEAFSLANHVVTENAYVDMYTALKTRAQASAALGHVEAATKDNKKAFALENAFESADIPTMDKAGYREEF